MFGYNPFFLAGITDPVVVQNYLKLGINTNFLSLYDEPKLFSNIARMCSAWVQETGTSPFTQRYGAITPTNASDEFSATISNSSDIVYPDGEYTIRWEGTGEIALGKNNALSTNIQDWTSVKNLTVTFSSVGVSYVSFRGTSLTKLEIVKTSNLTEYDSGNEWNPEYLTFLQGFSFPVLRAMNLAGINGNTQTDWVDRALSTDVFFLGTTPWEVIIDLANRLSVDLWITVPARATRDYQQQLATLLSANYTSGTLYIEKCNEAWNNAGSFAMATNWVEFATAPVFDATLDPTTGIFTSVGHGLSNGDSLKAFKAFEEVMKGSDLHFTFENGTDFTVSYIDADTFSVLKNGNPPLLVSDYPDWDSGTTYAVDDLVNYSGKYYKSLISSNLNNIPSSSPTEWVQVTADAYIETTHEYQVFKNTQGLTSDLNGGYALLFEGMVDDFEANFPFSRLHRVLGSQGGNPSHTGARYNALVDPNKADSVGISVYYRGSGWSVQTSYDTTVMTPSIYTMQKESIVYFGLYLATDTPSNKEVKEGVGAIAFETLQEANVTSNYTPGTQVTGLVDGTPYKASYVLVDEYGYEDRFDVPFTYTTTPDTITTYDDVARFSERATNDILAISNRYEQHQAQSPLPVIAYEFNNDYAVSAPTGVKDWLDQVYYPSTYAELNMIRLITDMAKYGTRLACVYKDASTSTFSLTQNISNPTADGRYRGFEFFNSQVEIPDNFPVMVNNSPSILTEPTNPYDVFYDFSVSVTSVNPVTYSIKSGNDDGRFNLNQITGRISISVGFTHDWNTVSTFPLIIEVNDGTNISWSLQEMTLGSLTYADLVAESIMSNGGQIALVSGDRYLFDHALTSRFPTGSMGTYLPDVPLNETLTLKFNASVADNTDDKVLTVSVRGTVDGVPNTFIASVQPADNTSMQAYEIVINNNSTQAMTNLEVQYRFNGLSDASVVASAEIENMYYLQTW